MTAAQGRASLAAALAGVLVGASMVATRAASHDASPQTLAFLRYLMGACILIVPTAFAHLPRFKITDAVAVAGLGVLQFAVLVVLLNYALVTLPAATCALVFATMPLTTMCMAVLSLRERYSATASLGMVLALLGIGVLLGPALPVSALAMWASVTALAGFCWATENPLLPVLTAFQWANVTFIGFASAAGYFCWIWALGRLEASRVVAFQALAPITAATLELSPGHWAPSGALLLAVVLVVLGLLMGACRWPGPIAVVTRCAEGAMNAGSIPCLGKREKYRRWF